MHKKTHEHEWARTHTELKRETIKIQTNRPSTHAAIGRPLWLEMNHLAVTSGTVVPIYSTRKPSYPRPKLLSSHSLSHNLSFNQDTYACKHNFNWIAPFTFFLMDHIWCLRTTFYDCLVRARSWCFRALNRMASCDWRWPAGHYRKRMSQPLQRRNPAQRRSGIRSRTPRAWWREKTKFGMLRGTK